MKKQFNSVLPEDFKIANRMCIVCGKKTEGYGCWHEGYTCSRKCEEVKESQPRNFGEHQHICELIKPADDEGIEEVELNTSEETYFLPDIKDVVD